MTSRLLSARLYWSVVTVCVVAGCARIASTYSVLSQTADEPTHIACGLELLSRGTYKYEAQHPPLSRVAAALGPYMLGIRTYGLANMRDEGNTILHSGGEYWRNLSWARLFELPFFILGAVAVHLWTCTLYGRLASLLAVLLYVCCPTILAHAGLATTDIALAGTLPLALFAFWRWWEECNWRRSLLLGACVGIMLLAKYSSLLFFPVCALGLMCVLRNRFEPQRPWIRQSALALLALCVVYMAGFGFRLTAIRSVDEAPIPELERILDRQPVLRPVATAMLRTPLPMMQLVRGVLQVARHSQIGHSSYFMGESRESGWWYFFPVVFASKAPIPFLMLALALAAGLWRGFAGTAREARWLPLLLPVLVIGASMPATINIGARHVLPAFVFLCCAAGGGAAWLWAEGGRARGAVCVLVVWAVAGSVLAHPDYLSYYNEIAKPYQEKLSVDSDLDWGQDVGRLARRCRELKIPSIRVAVTGDVVLDKMNLPNVQRLAYNEPVSGYVAVSLYHLTATTARLRSRRGQGAEGPFDWLRHCTLVERVGQTMFLYRVDELPCRARN